MTTLWLVGELTLALGVLGLIVRGLKTRLRELRLLNNVQAQQRLPCGPLNPSPKS